MKFRVTLCFLVFAMGLTAFAQTGTKKSKSESKMESKQMMRVSPQTKATYDDIRSHFGFVPQFMTRFPEEAITGAWEEYKGLYLNERSALSDKTKELISLAVDSQMGCRLCLYFDKRSAQAMGINSREESEAIALASDTRHWSTFINGIQIEESAFKRETDQIMTHMRPKTLGEMVQPPEKEQAGTMPEPPTSMNSAEDADRDIQKTFGLVPEFLRRFPREGIVGAWKEMKSLLLNPQSAIPNKEKELVSLAVASQIPCKYCTYFHTEAAKLHGATDREISEAVALAGANYHWSVFVNGTQEDEKAFRQETDKILSFRKTHMPKRRQMGGEAAGESSQQESGSSDTE